MAYANKGDITMPNRDTTGPMGTGMRTGRQMGPCGQNDSVSNLKRGRGMGRGCGRGLNKGFCRRTEYSHMNDQEFLKQEKLILEQRLSFINSQLTQE